MTLSIDLMRKLYMLYSDLTNSSELKIHQRKEEKKKKQNKTETSHLHSDHLVEESPEIPTQ